MATERNRLLPAFLWMFVSSLSFASMNFLVKKASLTISEGEIISIRVFINFILMAGLIFSQPDGKAKILNAPQKNILYFRGVAGFCGICSLFYAIRLLPVSVATLLTWCSPAFVILFSMLFLKERLQTKSLIGIAFAFCGLVLLLKPDWVSGQGTSLSPVGIFFGLIGAAFAGLAYVAVRATAQKTSSEVIIFYFTGVASILSIPLVVYSFKTPTSHEAGLLFGIGILASLAQYTMTQAYRFAVAGLVSAMGMMTAAFSAFFGVLFLGESLGLIQWSGVLVIASGISFAALCERR